MEIRKCLETDIPRTGEFYDRVVAWLDGHINYPRWVYRVYPSESSVRAMAAAGHQYICVRDEEIIGAFALDADPQGSFQKGQWKRKLADGSYMVLHALATGPDVQQQGLGSEIIRFSISKAKEEGYKALRVDVVPGNLPARKLFEKHGFAYAGDADLGLNIDEIPVFSLYEFNWQM